MLARWLKEITNIDGVEGVFVATNRADIVNKSGFKLSDDELRDLTKRFLRIIASFDYNSEKITELEYYWQNYYIICKNSNHFMLVTVCRSPKVLALLRITLNVAMANLLEDRKFSKWLKSHIADRGFFLRKEGLTLAEEKLLASLK